MSILQIYYGFYRYIQHIILLRRSEGGYFECSCLQITENLRENDLTLRLFSYKMITFLALEHSLCDFSVIASSVFEFVRQRLQSKLLMLHHAVFFSKKLETTSFSDILVVKYLATGSNLAFNESLIQNQKDL